MFMNMQRLLAEWKEYTKLITEEVFGAQAYVYHGSAAAPDDLIPVLLDDKLKPGSAAGSMYGKGLYTVYDLSGTATSRGRYGEYVYKLKINLYGFIIFDSDVAEKVYGKSLTPAEQAKLLGHYDVAKKLKDMPVNPEKLSSEVAYPASKFLKSRVKGIIFTGGNDGRVAVIYDPTVTTPIAWKRYNDENWTAVDRSLLKKSIARSASGAWEEEKYNMGARKLAVLKNLPPEKRIFKGDIEFIDETVDQSMIPSHTKIEGNLIISNSGNTSRFEMPNGFTVTGIINAVRSLISFGEGININDFNAEKCGLDPIPADAKFNNMYLYGARAVLFPPNFHIDGDITIADVLMRGALPDGMSVGKNLKISYGNVESLPKDLSVGGDLDISFAKIKSIKAGLSVGGDFNAAWLRKIKLPRNITVGKNLNLHKSQLTSLPPGLKVGGDLFIKYSKIQSLPDDLEVGGVIYLEGSEIYFTKQVPEHLRDKLRWDKRS